MSHPYPPSLTRVFVLPSAAPPHGSPSRGPAHAINSPEVDRSRGGGRGNRHIILNLCGRCACVCGGVSVGFGTWDCLEQLSMSWVDIQGGSTYRCYSCDAPLLGGIGESALEHDVPLQTAKVPHLSGKRQGQVQTYVGSERSVSVKMYGST